jgi:hypothetical protein
VVTYKILVNGTCVNVAVDSVLSPGRLMVVVTVVISVEFCSGLFSGSKLRKRARCNSVLSAIFRSILYTPDITASIVYPSLAGLVHHLVMIGRIFSCPWSNFNWYCAKKYSNPSLCSVMYFTNLSARITFSFFPITCLNSASIL